MTTDELGSFVLCRFTICSTLTEFARLAQYGRMYSLAALEAAGLGGSRHAAHLRIVSSRCFATARQRVPRARAQSRRLAGDGARNTRFPSRRAPRVQY